jgi:hypothetical protein
MLISASQVGQSTSVPFTCYAACSFEWQWKHTRVYLPSNLQVVEKGSRLCLRRRIALERILELKQKWREALVTTWHEGTSF